MTITIEVPTDLEGSLKDQARAEGLSVEEEFVRSLLTKQVDQRSDGNPDQPSSQRLQGFHAWSESPSRSDLPVRSDYAISRESIYQNSD